VSDYEAVRRTLAEFCHRADAGDSEGWLDLFCPDGAMHFSGQTMRSREGLAGFLATDYAFGRGMHLTTDSRIDINGDTATAVSKFLYIGPGGDFPMSITGGVYDDVLTRSSDGGWLFQDRHVVVALNIPG
jgi:hypothetical protein